MRNLILFLAIITLFSCATNKNYLEAECLTKQHKNEQVIPLKLPNWFVNMPAETGLAIGIAATNNFNPELTNSNIRENASTISTRNKSAIVIAKLKMKDNQRVMTPALSEFKLQITNDIPELKRYYKNSQIFNSTELCGMTIGLVGEKTNNLDLNESIIVSDKQPKWYKENSYTSNDNYLTCSGKSLSSNMATAYKNAYDEAVYNLITGIKSKVQSEIINSQNYTEKFVEIDASLIIENMRNSRNSLILKRFDNSFIYEAYVEIKWQAEYKVKQIKIME